jgi:hypothetical protein
LIIEAPVSSQEDSIASMMAIIECKNTFSIAIKRKMAYSN